MSYNFVKDIRKAIESLQWREKINFLELLENRDINTTKAKKCAKMTDKLKIYSWSRQTKKQEKYTSIEKLYKKQTKEYYLLINYYINIYNYPHNNNKLTK